VSRSSTRRCRSPRRPTPRLRCAPTPDASIVRAARAVADGDADAFVSGGSTGPALAAGLFNIRRARGIHRPALAIPVPVPDHPVIIVDVGANVEVRPEHLVQFGFMGAALAETILGVERPRSAAVDRRGGHEGHAARRRGPRRAARPHRRRAARTTSSATSRATRSRWGAPT
jgi:fatty acid/phospholipid biosynthesis enzyme